MFRKEESKCLWTYSKTRPCYSVSLKEPKHFPLPDLTSVPGRFVRAEKYAPLSTELWVFRGGGQKGEKTCPRLPVTLQSTHCD